MDTFIDVIYKTVRGWTNSTFAIVMGVIAFLGFYAISVFLKANKKESAKVSKPSALFWAIIMVILLMVLPNIRY